MMTVWSLFILDGACVFRAVAAKNISKFEQQSSSIQISESALGGRGAERFRC